MENIQRIEAIVSGRVQLVMFRDFTCRNARKLALRGSVKNMPDGTVQVIAEGEREKLLAFIEILKRGSLLSRVESVKVEWTTPVAETHDFVIVY